MSRNLVLCLDGTNNQYAGTNTNVVNLYAMLDRATNEQLAYYQPGIGTMPPPSMWYGAQRWLIRKLDLAFALLLKEHVTDAYRFLMRYYEDGDNIYLFGFSRGAYTARVLAGMLYKIGLLSRGNEELVPFAWDAFKQEDDMSLAAGFRHTFCRKARVRFLGVWDTVSSVGWVPFSPQHFQYTKNNPGVDVVRHAVAIDERRAYFVQNLWGATPGQDVHEVWFSGVHCDVGGGYKEAGLATVALAWMTREAEAKGLRINAGAKAIIIPPTDTKEYPAPNPLAPKHESLTGPWWIPEFIPKRIKDPEANYAPRWIWPRGRRRTINPGATIHRSVQTRETQNQNYHPTNLPTNPTVID